uniref:ATP-dependent RNA helicase DHX36 isoform X1 n=1 Tax=Rhizophora mucronata TaxID=61149 RepID=A0A2P2KTA7_RHIMU
MPILENTFSKSQELRKAFWIVHSLDQAVAAVLQPMKGFLSNLSHCLPVRLSWTKFCGAEVCNCVISNTHGRFILS